METGSSAWRYNWPTLSLGDISLPVWGVGRKAEDKSRSENRTLSHRISRGRCGSKRVVLPMMKCKVQNTVKYLDLVDPSQLTAWDDWILLAKWTYIFIRQWENIQKMQTTQLQTTKNIFGRSRWIRIKETESWSPIMQETASATSSGGSGRKGVARMLCFAENYVCCYSLSIQDNWDGCEVTCGSQAVIQASEEKRVMWPP
jgi:hypothetical protein